MSFDDDVIWVKIRQLSMKSKEKSLREGWVGGSVGEKDFLKEEKCFWESPKENKRIVFGWELSKESTIRLMT